MSKEKLVKISQINIIKTDVSRETFRYFLNIIESSCFEEYFVKQNFAAISNNEKSNDL